MNPSTNTEEVAGAAGLLSFRGATHSESPYRSQVGFDIHIPVVDWAGLGRQILGTALEEAGDGAPLDVEMVIRQGHAAQVLVEVSAGAQLLVVGSRGHGGFAGLLLGSVSEYVIAHASCPVLVIRAQEPATVAPEPAPIS